MISRLFIKMRYILPFYYVNSIESVENLVLRAKEAVVYITKLIVCFLKLCLWQTKSEVTLRKPPTSVSQMLV